MKLAHLLRAGILFFFLAVGSGRAYAAGVTVFGVVQNTTGQPIENASVQLVGTRLGTNCDSDGRFELPALPVGKLELRFSHIGYVARTLTLDSGAGQTAIDAGIVQLQAMPERLEPVLFLEPGSRLATGESASSSSLVGGAELRLEQPQSTAEALREVPGVEIQKTSHGGGHAIVRGMTSNRVLLLVDGIRLNNSTYRLGNHPYLTFVDPNSVANIEVVRGPGSILHGSDALGGSINLITQSAPFSDSVRTVSATTTGGFRSADGERLLHSRLAFSSRTWSLDLSAGEDAVGDLRRGESGGAVMDPDPPVVQTPTGFDVRHMMGTLKWRPGKRTLVSLSHQRTVRPEVPRYDKLASGNTLRWSYVDQRRELTYARLARGLGLEGVTGLHATASLQRQTEGRSTQGSATETRTDEYDEVLTHGLDLSGDWTAGRWRGMFGVEEYHDEVHSQRVYREPDGGESEDSRGRYPDGATCNSLGVYTQQTVQAGAGVNGEFGVRYSRFDAHMPKPGELPFSEVDLTFDAFTGSAGMFYDLTEESSLYFRLAQGFRAPNLGDLAKLGESKGSTFEVPNTALVPEELLSAETGVKLDGQRVRGEADVFISRLDNTIVSVPSTWEGSDEIVISGDTLSVRTKSNEGRGLLWGVEWGGELDLTGRLTLRSSLTWTWGQNETLDEPFDGIQPLTGYCGLRYRGPRGRLSLEPYVRFAAKQDRLSSDDLEDDRIPAGGTPGWWTLNLRSELTLDRHTGLALALENLFDRNYRVHASGLNAPGRQVVVTLRLKSGGIHFGK